MNTNAKGARTPRKSRQVQDHREQNLIAAWVILEHPERYRGVMLDWARRIASETPDSMGKSRTRS